MAKNYRKSRKANRKTRKSCRKATRRSSRSRRNMRGGFQDAPSVAMAEMSYKSPFVTNMVRY